MSLSRAFALILHGGAASIMAWGFQMLNSLPQDGWISKQKGGHLQFLTIQGLGIAFITMTLSAFLDVVPSVTAVAKLKRSLFMIAMPLAVVISTIYWSLLLTVPNLILQADPSKSEPSSSADVPALLRIPLSMDLALHAVPGLTLLVDFYLFEQKFSAHEVNRRATLVTAVFCTWYTCWVEYCASYNGAFPYPFLTENPFPVRCAIYAGASGLALLSFRGINALHA